MTGYEMTNLADVLTRHARERPWAVAIIENDDVVHYRTLEQMVWGAAWFLHRAGIRPGDVIGLSLPHSGLFLVAMFALARLGAVSVALPVGDPALVSEVAIRRLGVRSVVVGVDGAGHSDVPTVLFTADSAKAAPVAIPEDLRFAGGEHPWMIRRTSGTTGEAKGIAITHRDILACYATQAVFYGGPMDRTLATMDVAMSYGLTECLRVLFAGGAIVMAPRTLTVPQLFDHIDRYAITRLALTANMFIGMLPFLPTDGCRCPGLSVVTASTMAMPETLRAEIRRRFSRGLLVRYGSNEAHALAGADAAMQEAYPETVGRALPGVEIEIVDDKDCPVAAGEAGHIRARAPWMPTGYVNVPDAEDRTFRNGWVYLGDIGVLSPEGMLFIKGRADDMINHDGLKIMPADIEETLLAHPAVAEAVAFPIASSRHQHLPAAAVVLRRPASGEELLAHCQKRLGPRAPMAISIEAALPRNPAGKVIRRELAEKIAAKLPASVR